MIHQFQQIFNNDFTDYTSFLDLVLFPVFGENNFTKGYDVLTQDPEIKQKAAEANIEEIRHIGTFSTDLAAEIKLFDIVLSDHCQIERSRINIQQLIRRYVETFEGAFMVFHYKNPENRSWRFSYVEKRTSTTDSTSAKRYTYLFGKDFPNRTAAERFNELYKLQQNISLRNITEAFSVETLTKEFYAELSNWYFWTLQNVDFPNSFEQDKEVNNSTSVIRLITRLMFVWFLKQKKLISDELFDTQELSGILNYNDKTGSTYYKAILQNLFFATLNTEMGEKRRFINRQSGIQGFYRYERFFKNKERFIELTKNIPFLNGGLFENLDKNVGEENEMRIDCFSNRIDKEQLLKVPDFIFFAEENKIDLNKIYDTKGKTYKVRGIIDILKSFNFTIEENTPDDVEVALDPELLGKVFENLLASYNPETQTTARKQTGSFYTPRDIVDYMVNESLAAYLQEKIGDDWENNVQTISVLNKIKIFDPACGSGAFPMGVLHRMVQLLQKLDPNNKLWKHRQLDIADKIEDSQAREVAIANIEEAFEENELNYGRKLFLIENCIFGVDIQPIAVQISKLRFFISLICEQIPNPEKPNLGIRPLPNLETKFVAANTLIGLDKPQQMVLGMSEIEPLEKQLAEVRHKHFSARTPETKRKYRDRDCELRTQIAEKLKEIGFNNDTAKKIVAWNPYDQNTHAEWFDAEWMFDINNGFDIVIGNPPWVSLKGKQGITETKRNNLNVLMRQYNDANTYMPNLFEFFILFSLKEIKRGGILTFIVPDRMGFNIAFSSLRKKMLSKFRLIEIVYKWKFDMIIADTMTFIVKKELIDNYSFRIKTRPENQVLFYSNKDILQTQLSEFRGFDNVSIQDLVSTIMRQGNPLSNFCKSTSGFGGKSELITDVRINNTQIEVVRGRSIAKFCLLKKYFFEFQDDNITGRTRDEIKLGKKEKILLRKTGSEIIATYDNNAIYPEQSLYFLYDIKDNPLFLLGVLNSKLINWYYCNRLVTNEDSTPQLKNIDLDNIPIPSLSKKQQPIIILLVDYILYLKNAENPPVSNMVNNEVIASYFEKVIDACVYELYFEEEIKAAQVDVLGLVGQSLDKVSTLPVEQQILRMYEEWNEYKNEVRNRIILQETRSGSVAQIIKSINQ